MSLDHLIPHSGNNAIQSMLFALEWVGGSLAAGNIDIAEAALKIKAELGEFTVAEDLMAFTVSMPVMAGQVGPTSTTDAPHLAGFTLKIPSASPDWPARAITFSHDSLVVQINDYTRWAEVQSAVRRYVETFMREIGDRVQVAAIGHQVIDLFHWAGDPKDLHLDEVFRVDSNLLPRNIFELEDFWHSHHGYLKKRLVPLGSKQLDNINISRIPTDADNHAIQIVASYRIQYPSPQFISEPSQINFLMSLYDEFHCDNKSALTDLLEKDVLSKLDGFVCD